MAGSILVETICVIPEIEEFVAEVRAPVLRSHSLDRSRAEFPGLFTTAGWTRAHLTVLSASILHLSSHIDKRQETCVHALCQEAAVEGFDVGVVGQLVEIAKRCRLPMRASTRASCRMRNTLKV